MKIIKSNFFILFISVLISIYSFELYLILKNENTKDLQIKEKIYLEKFKKKYDNRTKYQVYKDLKLLKNNVQVDFPPRFFLKKNYTFFPLSGVSDATTVQCNENGYYSIYQSDRYGFNNPDEEWNKREIEYLIVGDSFAHGYCVNRPNDIASVLRYLSKKHVLNLGYAGNGPLIEYATLREYLNPGVKKVLWLYMEGNDITDLKSEKSNSILKNYLTDQNYSQNLNLNQNEINKLLNILIEKEELKKLNQSKYKYLKFLRLDSTKKIFKKKKVEKKDLPFDDFEQILKLTKTLTYKNGSNLYFVYLPTYSKYKQNYERYHYNIVKKIVDDLNIPFIDISKEVFEREENPLIFFPFELFGHYNEEGYKKVAKFIFDFTK